MDRSSERPAPTRVLVYSPSPDAIVQMTEPGAVVVVVDDDPERAARVVADVENAGGRAALFVGPFDAAACTEMIDALFG